MKATSSVTRGAAGMDRRPTEAETAAALDKVIERYAAPDTCYVAGEYCHNTVPPPPETPINVTHGVAEVAAWQAEDEITPRRWRWKNLRSCSVAVRLIPLPWDWHVCARTYNNYTEIETLLRFGPIGLDINASVGNPYCKTWLGTFGMTEDQAWEASK